MLVTPVETVKAPLLTARMSIEKRLDEWVSFRLIFLSLPCSLFYPRNPYLMPSKHQRPWLYLAPLFARLATAPVKMEHAHCQSKPISTVGNPYLPPTSQSSSHKQTKMAAVAECTDQLFDLPDITPRKNRSDLHEELDRYINRQDDKNFMWATNERKESLDLPDVGPLAPTRVVNTAWATSLLLLCLFSHLFLLTAFLRQPTKATMN